MLKLVGPAMRMIALAILPAILMLVLGWSISEFMPHLWPRLIIAGIGTLFAMAFGLQLLSPHLLHLGVRTCFKFIEHLRVRR
jgi:uncharacterized membrane protein